MNEAIKNSNYIALVDSKVLIDVPLINDGTEKFKVKIHEDGNISDEEIVFNTKGI